MTDSPETIVALALGSNIGDRLAALHQAIAALTPYITVTGLSQVYETEPAYVTDQGAFLNAAILGATKLGPLPLLWLVKDIERDMGRTPTFRNGPRLIDIDILFYGDEILQTPELTLPHRSMTERSFVLYPLNDIAPEWRHPVLHKTVANMLADLPDESIACLGRAL